MKNLRYILMVLLGGTLYGTMSSFVKLAYSHGFHAAELSFGQALLAAVFLGLCTLLSGKAHKGDCHPKQISSLLMTGCTIGLTNFLYYESVQYIPASLAIILLMQFAWLSLLLEWIVFGRKPLKVEWLTVFCIFVGTVLAGGVLHTREWNISSKGVMLAVASSLTYAVYIIANGRVGKKVGWQAKSAAIMMGSSSCIFVINAEAIIGGNYMGTEFMLWVLFLAVFGTTIPTALFAAGISKIGAGLSSILMTVELPVAILCARVVLNEQITALQLVGIGIMLLSLMGMNYYKVNQFTNGFT
ncbi:MAG: EamA family transporter [Bacteroides sp.]|nr:EamA family transporter [Bacteroides sp.]